MKSVVRTCGLALAGRIRHYARLFMIVASAMPLLLGGALAASAEDARLRLELRDARGALLWSAPAREGTTFAIRYRHSVALTPVEDWFAVVNGVIELQRSEYQDFGAGLPHAPEQGQSMRVEGGRVIMDGYHRPLPSFDVRVGRVARHMLLLDDADGRRMAVPLDSLARPGQVITFGLGRVDADGGPVRPPAGGAAQEGDRE